jgi:hypothetical protein
MTSLAMMGITFGYSRIGRSSFAMKRVTNVYDFEGIATMKNPCVVLILLGFWIARAAHP